MMTGAILGGSSVQQAAKMQMIIMFMITASTTMATIFTTFSAMLVAVDNEHRIRGERIIDQSQGITERVAFGLNLKAFWPWLKGLFKTTAVNVRLTGDDTDSERQRLLS